MHAVRNTSAAVVQEKNRLLQLKRTSGKLLTFVAATLSDRDGNRFRTSLRTASPFALLMVISVKDALSLGIRKSAIIIIFLNRTISDTWSFE